MSWTDYDEESLIATELEWEPDPHRFLRLRTRYREQWIYMWVNPDFPDSALYSLEVGPDETREFDDLPQNWRHEVWEWPEDVDGRPDLPEPRNR